MSLYPTIIVDDVLENVDLVVDFANSLEYKSHPRGMYAGGRTECISKLSPHIFNEVVNNIIGQMYDIDNEEILVNASSFFQKIDPKYGDSFVHRDNCELTSIIYLNKKYPRGFGTSFYEFSSHEWVKDYIKDSSLYYSEQKVIDDNYFKIKDMNNSQFTKTISVENKYNRMVVFDGSVPHKGDGIDGNNLVEERLSIVTFINYFGNKGTPKRRIRKLI